MGFFRGLLDFITCRNCRKKEEEAPEPAPELELAPEPEAAAPPVGGIPAADEALKAAPKAKPTAKRRKS